MSTGPAVCDPNTTTCPPPPSKQPAGQSLKKQWDLSEPAPLGDGTNDKAKKFVDDFKAAIEPVKQCLLYTKVNAEKTKHEDMAGKRDRKYQEFPKQLTDVNKDEAKADSISTPFLGGVRKLAGEANVLKQKTEASLTAWQSKEPDYIKSNDDLDELEQWGEWTAMVFANVRKSRADILSASNENKYDEAIKLLAPHITNLKPLYAEYQKQKAAKEKYDPAIKAIESDLAQSTDKPFKPLESMQSDLRAVKTQMDTAVHNKDYVKALQHVTDITAKLKTYSDAVKESEKQKQEYTQASADLTNKLNDASQSKFATLQSKQDEMARAKTEMEATAEAGNYQSALQQAKSLDSKLVEYSNSVKQLDEQKQAYVKVRDPQKSRLENIAEKPHVKLAAMKKDIDAANAEMDAAEKKDEYPLAQRTAEALKARLGAYDAAAVELDNKKAVHDKAMGELEQRLNKVAQSKDDTLQPMRDEIQKARDQINQAVQKEDYEQAQVLVKCLTSSLDNLKELEKGKIYRVKYKDKKTGTETPYLLTPAELAQMRMEIGRLVAANCYAPLKSRAEMNANWYKDLERTKKEFWPIAAVVNAMGGAKLESILKPLNMQCGALDAASNAISNYQEDAETKFKAAIDVVDATSKAINEYMDALGVGGERTVLLINVLEITAVVALSVVAAPLIVEAGLVNYALSSAGVGAFQSVVKDVAHNKIMNEKPISAEEMAKNATIKAVSEGAGAAIGALGTKVVSGRLAEKVIADKALKQTLSKDVLTESIASGIGNTLQTAVSQSPDLCRGRMSEEQFGAALATAFVVGTLTHAAAAKLQAGKSPAAANKSKEEIDTSVKELKMLPERGTRQEPNFDWRLNAEPDPKSATSGLDHVFARHSPFSTESSKVSRFKPEAWNNLRSLVKETVQKGQLGYVKDPDTKLPKGAGAVYEYKFPYPVGEQMVKGKMVDRYILRVVVDANNHVTTAIPVDSYAPLPDLGSAKNPR